MQCKDIPEQPILDFLVKLGENPDENVSHWATWFPGFDNSVQNAMPPGVPEKLALAKMKQMVDRGLVNGCPCGCRGDFRLEA